MKKILLAACLLFSAGLLFAQSENPVSWSASARKTGDRTYEIRLEADIKPGWHIYSQTTPEGGPIPTSISFRSNPLLSTEGGTKEVGDLEKHFEPLFGVDVKQFSNKVSFVQTVKLKASSIELIITLGNIPMNILAVSDAIEILVSVKASLSRPCLLRK